MMCAINLCFQNFITRSGFCTKKSQKWSPRVLVQRVIIVSSLIQCIYSKAMQTRSSILKNRRDPTYPKIISLFKERVTCKERASENLKIYFRNRFKQREQRGL